MHTLILGIGNILWADEGFGVRAVEQLAEEWQLPAEITLLDGGTQGLYLLPYVEAAESMIIFDAVDYGLAPGSLRLVRDEAIPNFLGVRKMSLHQTSFQEVLATASLIGRKPQRMLLIGVQPACVDDYGGGLSDLVAAQIPPAVEHCLGELCALGCQKLQRQDQSQQQRSPLSRRHYEAGRPTAEDACRVGDARFLSAG